jgi:hypothetical protein
MRRFVLSVSCAGILSGSAMAQFGSAPPAAPMVPTPAAPAPFGGTGPMTPAPSYVPPVGGLQPTNTLRPAGSPAAPRVAPVEIPLALGPNHPLAVKPEDGAYFICVRSYSRPSKPDSNDVGFTVKQLSEALAAEIQQSHKEARVFLYELVSEEKKAQIAAQTAARQRAAEFAASIEQYRQRAALAGADSFERDDFVKYQTFHYRDQVAVLIGGFRTEDEAVKALAIVKKWPSPKFDDISPVLGKEKKHLMDVASHVVKKDGKSELNKAYVNPYAQAMVVQNPAIAKQMATQPMQQDPFILRLNEGRPYNLLKATKKWTLAVKSFSAPVHYTSKDEESKSVMNIFKDKDADILARGADQAEALAKALREMKDETGKSLNIEAFVLHTRMASLVTVGDYETPNDPDLLAKQRILSNMTFNLSRDPKGTQITGQKEKMFGDMIQPVPIPRRQ